MKNRRKADLQRKLQAAPLPKPPAGLADRIKRDIPGDFTYTTDQDRNRFTIFNALSLRVAASILVLVGGAYFAIRLLSEANHTSLRSKSAITMPTSAPVPAVAHRELDASRDIQMTEQAAPPAVAEAKPMQVAVVTDEVRLQKKDKKQEEEAGPLRRDEEAQSNALLADGLNVKEAAGVTGGKLAANEALPPAADTDKGRALDATSTIADLRKTDQPKEAATRAVASAPPPPPPQAAAAPVPEKVGERVTVTAGAPAVVPASKAMAQASFAKPPSLFGISTDRQAFDRIKFTIEHGDRPAADSVDVAALVNYFAGAPDRMRHPVALDLETSTRPVRDGEPIALVRVSVDTAETIDDAKLDIVFDPMSVASYHRVDGGTVGSATEPVVEANRSVTALYEIELKPNVRARQAVATATLAYRGANGAQTLTRWVSYSEAKMAWKTRSRRHRLATLGAIWAETLRTSAAGQEVAATAEQLSKQEPKDEKAKELATLATASSRLRSSSPTGSGR